VIVIDTGPVLAAANRKDSSHQQCDAPYRRCWRCHQHRAVPGARLADAVVPIAYGVKGEQHYHDLVVYKGKYPAPGARKRLRDSA